MINGDLVYLIYLDESGNTGSRLDDPQQPIHTIVGVIVRDRHWHTCESQMNGIIEDYIPPADRQGFEFHTSDLFQGRRYFAGWQWVVREEILNRLIGIITNCNLPMIYGAVHKPRLAAQYAYPADPHALAFLFLAERIEGWFQQHANDDTGMFIADETKADAEMRKSLRDYRTVGIPLGIRDIRLEHIVETVHFADSRLSVGIQIADVANYFVRRHLEAKANSERFYQAFQGLIADSRVFP
jgi:hypothetical protein